MRKLLDRLYAGAEWLAMLALIAIVLMVLAQVIGRIVDWALMRLGQPIYGFQIASMAEIAGFLLVAASFLALAEALRGGNHIRVTLAITPLPPAARRVAESVVLAAGAAVALFFAWYTVLLAWDSYRFHNVSFGIVVIPLWIPQGVMAFGIVVFAVALLDEFIGAVSGRTPSYVEREALLENQE